ncbi:MAG: hypothetical protein VX593_06630, partial [Pseudomonadota bacterium]|nr:hypothetical protein [Pseudomonadota bacterium]
MSRQSNSPDLLAAAIEAGRISPLLPLASLAPVPTRHSGDDVASRLAVAVEMQHSLDLAQRTSLGLADLVEQLGDAPRNAELAEALVSGLPEPLIEAGLRHPGGFPGLERQLRHNAMSIPPQAPVTLTAEEFTKASADVSAARAQGVSLCVGEFAVDATSQAMAIDLAAFVSAEGLELGLLRDTVAAARKQVQADDGLTLILHGIAAGSVALAPHGEADPVKRGSALISACAAICGGKALTKADVSRLGLDADVEVAPVEDVDIVIAPLRADAALPFLPSSEGLSGECALTFADDDGAVDLSAPVRLALSGHASVLEKAETALQAASDIDAIPGLNRQTLRSRGFSDEALLRVSNAIGEGLPLSAAFSRWVLGDDVITKDLRLQPEAFDTDGLALLRAIGFSADAVEALDGALNGISDSAVRAALGEAGIALPNGVAFSIDIARASRKTVDAMLIDAGEWLTG